MAIQADGCQIKHRSEVSLSWTYEIQRLYVYRPGKSTAEWKRAKECNVYLGKQSRARECNVYFRNNLELKSVLFT